MVERAPLRAALLVGALLFPAVGATAADDCPGVTFTGAKLGLTDVEHRLVCGDPDSEAWRTVPRSQSRSLLESFLQQRGYLFPEFTTTGETLSVDPGRVTAIASLVGEGLPPGIDLSKRRRIVGEPLTPKKLDEVEAAVCVELQDRGYACPRVVMSADARDGRVTARFAGGVVHDARPIEEPAIAGVDPLVFGRFEAFRRDRPLDQRLFTITSDRVVTEALFLSSSYEVSCGTAGVRIVHRVASAPPRIVRLGLGVDTEGLARVRAQWEHSRIGWRASTASATLAASKREQSLDAHMNVYLSPSSRIYLLPSAVAARSDEPLYETLSSKLSVAPAFTWDDQSLHLEVDAGPALEYADTRRGVGPQRSFFQSYDAHAEVTSHAFESHLRDPRDGFRAQLDTASRISALASKVTAHRVRLGTEELWNLGGYEPPLAVLGLRGWLGTTIIGDRATALRELPPATRFFIGGDADFRGVGPGELGDENGFLTGAYQGLELRAGDLLPYHLQPFLFLDGAMAGLDALRLDPNVYYAPGLGARWATFIGAFRVSFARNLVWQRDPASVPGAPHWQFFFSYGREF